MVETAFENKGLKAIPAKREKTAVHPDGDIAAVRMARHAEVASPTRAARRPRPAGLPVYATAGTLGGLKWLNRLGHADRGPEKNALGNLLRIDLARAVQTQRRMKRPR